MSSAHSPTFPSLHPRHSSFSNPFVASLTSKLILLHFFWFSYVTGSSLTSPGEPPMQCGGAPSCWNIAAGCYPCEGVNLRWNAPWTLSTVFLIILRQVINTTSLLKVRYPSLYAGFGGWISSILPAKLSLKGDWWLRAYSQHTITCTMSLLLW